MFILAPHFVCAFRILTTHCKPVISIIVGINTLVILVLLQCLFES